jgi:cytosine/adenosine deaminase-related metal-dependent hydrolase
VSDETIREAAAMCRELGVVTHVHLAEDLADVEDARRRGWSGPLERLAALGALPKGSILAHGVHLSAAEVREAEAMGCWIVQNPRSNRGNRVGYPAALRSSDRVAIGTDGYPSELDAELEALLDEGRRHGDDDRVAARRAAGGRALFAERFGARVAPPAGAGFDFAALRAEATLEAGRLWKRMGEL